VGKRRLIGLAVVAAALSCFGGIRYVGLGERCEPSEPGFSGTAACDDGLVCRPKEGGHCYRACQRDEDCASNQACALGVCVQACALGVQETCRYPYICCEPPTAGGRAACLSATDCVQWGFIPADGGAQ